MNEKPTLSPKELNTLLRLLQKLASHDTDTTIARLARSLFNVLSRNMFS